MQPEQRETLERTTRWQPAEVERRIFDGWIEGGYFHPRPPGSPEENFSVAVPPPNVTGVAPHGPRAEQRDPGRARPCPADAGAQHALDPRHRPRLDRRPRGPREGAASEGTSRHDLGRDAFLERAWEWKETYGSRIVGQLQRLGASCDYERERFTLDEGYVRAVYKVFVALYDKGYIYRDNYMVNWDVGSRSVISELEVENREVTDTLYEIDYPVEGSDDVLTVATVRPETMLADTAVAVNPSDERYGDLVGKFCTLPLVGRRLPIIADDHVDVEFGTGALKITPGHDPNDFEIGRYHGLEEIVVIGEDGLMNEEAGEGFAGLTTDAAQEAVLAALREQGLLRGEEPYTHSVPFSHRSGERIEPLISLQWFCRMDELAAPAIEVVETDKVKIAPDQWKRVYLDWMNNIRPWCVSRQLWWGHRIPVWYCDACEEVYVAESAPERCGACDGELRQEDDVLDTWFSSALWPFATLGWPDADSPELDAFYPTSFLTTARDILFLWVARMVMMGIEFAGRHPVRRRLRALGDPGPRRAADVEEPRHRHRPPRRDRPPRCRRAALRPAGDVIEPGRALLDRQGRAGPRPRQQALERLAARPPERGRGRAGAPRGPGRGSLDPLAPRAHGRARRREPRHLRLRPRGARALPVHLVRALRLVPGDREAAPLRR